VAKEHQPRGHDEKIKKVDVGWSDLAHGPAHHEDQKGMGKGTMNAHDEGYHKLDHDPGRNPWGPPRGSKENHRTDFVPGQKHKK
jgi:hypothetical protein